MKRFVSGTTRIAQGVIAVLLFDNCIARAAEQSPDDYFPLSKGTQWIYSADVDWTVLNTGGEVRHSHVTFKSEVTDVFSAEHVFAAKIRGFIHDLSWYEPGRPTADHVIVRVGVNRYYLIDQNVAEFWEKMIGLASDPYLEELGDDNILLETPLRKGVLYGEPAQTPRAWYCWAVTGERRVRMAQAVSRAKTLHEYSIRFQTSPDHTVMGFTPGIGITRYEYGHHGTVANCRARLIEFHRG